MAAAPWIRRGCVTKAGPLRSPLLGLCHRSPSAYSLCRCPNGYKETQAERAGVATEEDGAQRRKYHNEVQSEALSVVLVFESIIFLFCFLFC